jgi:DnaJ-class molecular chaperone
MRSPDTMPATEAEAREVLGVSAVAQERIVKKVVDALRQSWHPDHASDADDRRAREQRLKQINVAWDLINRRQDRAA